MVRMNRYRKYASKLRENKALFENEDIELEINIFENRVHFKGDLDNYIRIIMNILTGIVYKDDIQVTKVKAEIHRDSGCLQGISLSIFVR